MELLIIMFLEEEFKNISMIEEVNFGGNFYGVAQREFETDKDVW